MSENGGVKNPNGTLIKSPKSSASARATISKSAVASGKFVGSAITKPVRVVQKASAPAIVASDKSKGTEANSVKMVQSVSKQGVAAAGSAAKATGKTVYLAGRGGTKVAKVVMKKRGNTSALEKIAKVEKVGQKVGKATRGAQKAAGVASSVGNKVATPVKSLSQKDGNIEKNVTQATWDVGKGVASTGASAAGKATKKVAKEAGKKAVNQVKTKRAESKAIKQSSKTAVKSTEKGLKAAKTGTKSAESGVKAVKESEKAVKAGARVASKVAQTTVKAAQAIAKAAEEVVSLAATNPMGWIVGIVAALLAIIIMFLSFIPTFNFSSWLDGIPEWYLEQISDYTLHGNVTAYSDPPSTKGGQKTASGIEPGPGRVAVDPSEIPYGSVLYVPGYGWAVAADTGGFVNYNDDRIVDVWYETDEAAENWGKQELTVYVVEKAEPGHKVTGNEVNDYLENHPIMQRAIGGGAFNASEPYSNPTSYTNGNPYSGPDNCTYFAWGRVNEAYGIKLPAWGNAGDWYANAQKAGYVTYPKGTTPQPGWLIVFDHSINKGGYGHVAFVESVTGNTIKVSESGANSHDPGKHWRYHNYNANGNLITGYIVP